MPWNGIFPFPIVENKCDFQKAHQMYGHNDLPTDSLIH